MSSPRIPIAIVLTSLDAGGTERQMTELIARLDRSRFEVHVGCFRREGEWLGRVEQSADSVGTFPLRGFASLSTVGQLARFAGWCRRHRIAVVQACDFYANVFALAGAALARVPVRIGSRRDLLLPGRTDGHHRLQRHAYRAAHHVVANSRAAVAQVVAEGVPEARTTVIPNGIELSRYQAGVRSGVRSGIRPRAVVTTVANLREGKGHEVLLDAAARICAADAAVQFQIVGGGPLREPLERQAAARGLNGHVNFLGYREDIPELLAGSDVFVLPSRTEAFPNGLVEAMASGLPSVASDVGGIPELIQHGRNGLLVPAGDVAALAGAIERLLADEPLAASLGAAARATIATRYSFERMVASFEALYLRELAGSHVPIRALYAR